MWGCAGDFRECCAPKLQIFQNSCIENSYLENSRYIVTGKNKTRSPTPVVGGVLHCFFCLHFFCFFFRQRRSPLLFGSETSRLGQLMCRSCRGFAAINIYTQVKTNPRQRGARCVLPPSPAWQSKPMLHRLSGGYRIFHPTVPLYTYNLGPGVSISSRIARVTGEPPGYRIFVFVLAL